MADDITGANFGQSEQRDGLATSGEYHVALPDCRIQTVTYHVDDISGYVADVSYSGEPHVGLGVGHSTPVYHSPINHGLGHTATLVNSPLHAAAIHSPINHGLAIHGLNGLGLGHMSAVVNSPVHAAAVAHSPIHRATVHNDALHHVLNHFV